ncbi:MAG: type I methionyl aminopeptidase [Puniceicoccales bacterium]|jgi:methionyl aminopeptidase|nr:type I methionyl aminopeptidase [Puniceicoccales bacterium]
MINIKTKSDILKMRKAGQVAAEILDEVVSQVKVGISTAQLNDLTHASIKKHRATSATYHYKNGNKIFPGYACFSINDVVVHGIPSDEIVLEDGDVISIDVATCYDGFVGDNTRTIPVGNVDEKIKNLVNITELALQAGIDAAIPGNHVGDISYAIQCHADMHGYGVVKELVGHGVGRDMHEEPQVPNYGKPVTGPALKEGMTIAIEPMFTLGKSNIFTTNDGWTIKTVDGSVAAHCEHTILITNNEPEVLTLVKK